MGANCSGAVFRPLSGDQTCFANRTEIPIMKGLAVQGRAKPEMVSGFSIIDIDVQYLLIYYTECMAEDEIMALIISVSDN